VEHPSSLQLYRQTSEVLSGSRRRGPESSTGREQSINETCELGRCKWNDIVGGWRSADEQFLVNPGWMLPCKPL
jgi:hypothetical protein